MKKAIIIAACLVCVSFTAFTDNAENENFYNDIPVQVIFDELPPEATFADWEVLCNMHSQYADYNEYVRFMEIYGGHCDFEAAEYDEVTSLLR